MDSGFTSPRSDGFPAGLRVLVVDDDLAWLRILEKMLKKCSYEVTTCCLAREALDILRERKDGFDIVISDVNMPDMDGFKLLEHVGLEMDLPVIMMSVDGETSRVMRGVQHGACDYLLKPIRMKELRNIWQHVFRKRIHEVRDMESHDGFEEIQMMRYGSELSDDGYFLGGGEGNSGKKRKDVENKEFSDHSSSKKARVVWTVDLHQKFVKAVHHIGFDKVGPKKILDLMNVPWLTRENVASHLQKYRLYLGRLQKENEMKASFGGIKQPDPSPKDPAASLGLQDPMPLQQNDGSTGIYGLHQNIRITDAKTHHGDLKSVITFPRIEPKKAVIHDVPDPPKPTTTTTTTSSRMPNHSLVSPFDSWKEVPIPLGAPDPACNSRPFKEKPASIQAKPSSSNCRSQQIRGSENLSFSVQPDYHLAGLHGPGPDPGTGSSTKNPEASQRNQILGTSGFVSSNEDLFACLLQGNPNFQRKEPISYNYSEVLAESPAYLNETQRFDYWESMENVVDQGLFII